MLKFNVFVSLALILCASTSWAQVKKSNQKNASNSINNQTIRENKFDNSAGSALKKVSDTIIVAQQTDAVTAFDFGKIRLNRPVVHDFIITNTTTDSIYIKDVVVTCGCTSPQWSKNWLQPGAGTLVKVGFNAAIEGVFDKPFKVMLSNGNVQHLTVKGMVYAPHPGSVPPNAALQHLRNIDW